MTTKRIAELRAAAALAGPTGLLLDECLTEIERMQKERRETKAPDEAAGIVEAWNQCPALPKIRALTGGRAKDAATRLREPFFRAHWREAITRICRSSFATGQNDRGWVANIDWFLREGTVAKIMEGKYDNRQGPQRPAESVARCAL